MEIFGNFLDKYEIYLTIFRFPLTSLQSASKYMEMLEWNLHAIFSLYQHLNYYISTFNI